MLVAAALVPETALLVPGAAGAATVLELERDASLDAVRRLLAARPERVVVVTGAGQDRGGGGRGRGPAGSSAGSAPPQAAAAPRGCAPTLAAAGIPDDLVGLAGDRRPDGPESDVGTAVALHLLGQAGWDGPVTVVRADGAAAAPLWGVGADLAAGDGRVALLLSGSLSARRGPHGPLPDDERAPGFDDAVVAALVDLAAPSAARLRAVPWGLAAELAVSAWGPWQVLLGAAPERLHGTLHAAGAPFGATYAAISWVCE